MEEIREILMGGQTFSWSDEGSSFSGVLNNRVYRVTCEDDFLTDPYLREYYDASFDYETARKEIMQKDELLCKAVMQYPKLRILKQDPWITLISFILSQNNNIKRIKGLYDSISRSFGSEVEKGYYAFPTPDELKLATLNDLKELKVGFRDKYIVDACQKADILDQVWDLNYEDAEKKLMSIKGVGKKVASCILLFGYHRMEAFPIDVWIKRVLDKYYQGKEISYFEPYPALCQQYLFSLARFNL